MLHPASVGQQSAAVSETARKYVQEVQIAGEALDCLYIQDTTAVTETHAENISYTRTGYSSRWADTLWERLPGIGGGIGSHNPA